jgi:histidinol-phosphate aminotransferase
LLPSRLHLDAAEAYRIPEDERAGWLRLDVNEHPGGADPFVIEALRQALAPATVATYPTYAEWHRVAATYFGVRPGEVTCTAGGDEAIKAICEAFLLAGKAVAMLDPGYDMFRLWAKLYGNPLRPVALGPGFELDESAWFSALDRDVGLVALVNPNNPTGTCVPRQVIERTLETVDCPVVLDETYADFTGASGIDLIARHPHVFVVRSFSKAHGLAGLRAGAVLSQAANVRALRKVLNPFNVARPAIAASLAVLQRPNATAAHVAEVTAARAQFVNDLKDMGITTGPAHANFVLCDLRDRAGAATWALRGEGILVRDRSGTHPRLDGQVRIAIGTPLQMKRCAGALHKVMVPPPAIATLLLDMDGVLVDVQASYRRAIVETAQGLLIAQGKASGVVAAANAAAVEALKRAGGLNDDWECTLRLVRDLGGESTLDDVKAAFQQRYWGDAGDGYIASEPWLVPPDLLRRILARFRPAVVTGRPREEALHTLERNAARDLGTVLVAMEDTARRKPAPDPLLRALELLDGADPATAAYVGDAVDDLRAATAAGCLPIGVLPPQASWHDGLCERLYEAGARVVCRDLAEVARWLGA